jgi:phycoerythrin-associated linker protein
MTTFEPITVSRNSSREEREAALPCIYRQILERQPYVFERKILAKPEKDFLTDKIGVRRFIKELALSEVYLNSFFHNSSNTKFLELCFKHFFGRAPLNHEEMQQYCDLLMSEGAAKMMTVMLDSEEYRKAFGCFTVPYPRRQPFYESPNSYMESHLLNREHIGQRGRTLPTLYWHQLGLDCTGGVCHHPEANESIEVSLSQADLNQLLQMLQTAQPEKATASLSPQQKELLRRAIS